LSLAFLLSIVCFVATALVYRHNLERVTATKNWVEHTYEVIAKLEALNSVVTKTESGVRGFVATGDLSYLPQRDSASIAAEKLLHEISSLTSDNPSQQQRLARLTP
ncbi:CHASE3 domain-containing protein, partial [Klebsiella aerogenes]|uniref:CHASE3 domain-containing protein n=1 Tax=Klebsiella aerogenes TaxID=548 RepID=UPI00158BE7E4